MLIHDVKFDIRDDSILQNSSREPTTSFKFDCILNALLIILGSWQFIYNSTMTWLVFVMWNLISNVTKSSKNPVRNCQHPPCLTVFLCIFNHARELKSGIQLNNDILWLFVMSKLIPKMTQSSKTPFRNHQCPLSMTVSFMHLQSW